MMFKDDKKDAGKGYDFLIVGSGFSGSITAMALANSGFRVCLVEKEKHPRFAIGESSTPIADMILRELAERYNLPFLKELSRYGEWQKMHPEVVCGLKRGFSYYAHQKGGRFASDAGHSRELLVAASRDDENSDTNWLRSDVDHFLAKKVGDYTVDFFEECTLLSLRRDKNKGVWKFDITGDETAKQLQCRWVIDATGSSGFSEKFLGTRSLPNGFNTHSFALFSHFRDAKTWRSCLETCGAFMDDYPYNPDDSALHHLIEEGWIWMLRFNNGLLSAGIVFDGFGKRFVKNKQPIRLWESVLKKYPSIRGIFQTSAEADSPGTLIRTGRLQRKLNRTCGNGWVALPHTSGFVDPLHSTGIAHTLGGVEKILRIFTEIPPGQNRKTSERLEAAGRQFFTELEFIDLLVSVCYRSRGHFRLFSACVMLYFAASISAEQERMNGETPDYFLNAGDPVLMKLVREIHEQVLSLNGDFSNENKISGIINKIRTRIKPYNTAGLMDPAARNMYRHTAAVL